MFGSQSSGVQMIQGVRELEPFRYFMDVLFNPGTRVTVCVKAVKENRRSARNPVRFFKLTCLIGYMGVTMPLPVRHSSAF
jgi:hypothetical protein